MSTTPFEIRLELLKMSKDLLEHDYFAQKELAITDWQSRAGAAMANNDELPAKPELPLMPSEEAIIEKATKLKAFVDGK